MADFTLTGDIPGLLRLGSPVRRGARRGVVTYAGPGGWMVVESAPLDFDDLDAGPGNSAGTDTLDRCGWDLDLTDATGRAHAAWWLDMQPAERVPPEVETADGHCISAVGIAAIVKDVCRRVEVTTTEIALLRAACLHVAGVPDAR